MRGRRAVGLLEMVTLAQRLAADDHPVDDEAEDEELPLVSVEAE